MNHYERLGIGSDATPDEVRDAYRRAARAEHPDTCGTGDMAALNEAYRVLRDPARRARYDGELGGAGTEWSGSGDDHELDGSGERGSPGHRRRPVTLVAVLVVLAILFAMSAVARRPSPGPSAVDGFLQPGSCVVVRGSAAEVPCGEPHDGVVDQLLPMVRQCGPDLVETVDAAGSQRVCVRPQ